MSRRATQAAGDVRGQRRLRDVRQALLTLEGDLGQEQAQAQSPDERRVVEESRRQVREILTAVERELGGGGR